MKRIELHVKVTVDIDESDDERKIAAEVCRMVEKVYGVRRAEVSSIISPAE